MLEAAEHSTPAAGNALRTRAARGTLINTGFTVALGALGLLESFIMARFVTRAQYGVWGVLAITLATLLWLKQVGVGDKFVQQEEADQELAFQKAFTLELAFSAALVIVLVAAAPVVAVLYRLPQVIAPSAVLAFTLVVSAFQAPLWVYYRRMDFTRQRALAAVNPVIGFVVGVTLAALGAGYWAFVGGLAAGALAASIASVVGSPYPLRLRYEPGTLRAYTAFSGPLLIASGASFVMTWSAMIAAKVDLGIAALGAITLAATITSFTDQVDQLVTGTLYPAICAVRDQVSLLFESFVKSNRLALMIAVPFGTAVALFSSDLVRFGIGERWRPAVIVLEVCGLAAAINHVGFNWTAYFRAIGTTRPIATANLASTVGFLVVGIPLLLLFGLPGFAAGLAFQGLVGFVLRAYYLQRLFPGFVFLRHVARSFLPSVPAAALVLVLRLVEPGARSLALAVVELAAYLVVTVVMTWRLESDLLLEAIATVRGAPGAPVRPRVPLAKRPILQSMFGFRDKTTLVDAERALPGRDQEIPVAERHAVLGTPLTPPFPEGFERLIVGMGCFWGAERIFWEAQGVYTTAVGYAGGITPNPTYEEVCSGRTGHTEAVLVVFDPAKTSDEELLRRFWEGHDPTQGMRQGNDAGTQYRSAIYWTSPRQRELAEASRSAYAERLRAAGYATVTTEIAEAGSFYYAEDHHQQYLAKNPWGYCGIGGTGVSCPVGVGAAAAHGETSG